MSSTEHVLSDPKQTNSKIAALRDAFVTFDSHQSLVTSLSLQWQEFEDSFSAVREIVDVRQHDLVVKEKELESREKELESRQRQLENLKLDLELKQMQLDIFEEALQLKRKRLESLQKDAELRGKQLGFWEKDLELKQKQLLELKKSSDYQLRVDESKDEQMDTAGAATVESKPDNDSPLDAKEEATCLSFALKMDGKGLQRFLNDKVDEHKLLREKLSEAIMKVERPANLVLKAIDGFFTPHLTNGGEEYGTGIVRSSCILLLEQLLRIKPVISKPVRVQARGLANRWLNRIMEEGECYLSVLSFLLLVVTYDVSSSFGVAILERFLRLVHEDKRAPLIRRNFGKPVYIGTKQERKKFAQHAKVGSMCANMNVERLKSYLCDNALSKKMSVWAIRAAVKPGKLVFDVALSFGTRTSNKYQCDNYRKSCLSLLEVLVNLSHKVHENIRADALCFARYWNVRLEESLNKDPGDVYGLLQFMVAYKLTCSFSTDELIGLYKTFYEGPWVYKKAKMATLCRDLGLTDKIPGVVQTLIDDNQHICAVKYICVLGLGNDFSPTLLLKAYLDNIQKTVDGKKKNGTYNEQISAIVEEYNALEAIIKCITIFKLGSEFPSSDLKRRCNLLLEEKKELSKSPQSKTDRSTSTPELNKPEPEPETGTKRSSSAVASSSDLPAEHSAEKRRRIPVPERPHSYPQPQQHRHSLYIHPSGIKEAGPYAEPGLHHYADCYPRGTPMNPDFEPPHGPMPSDIGPQRGGYGLPSPPGGEPLPGHWSVDIPLHYPLNPWSEYGKDIVGPVAEYYGRPPHPHPHPHPYPHPAHGLHHHFPPNM